MTDDQAVLAILTDNSVAVPFQDRVDDLTKAMLDLPQVECPVIHRFGPGLYIRELSAPAGAMLVGHRQRFDHMNVMLKGKVKVVNEDGTTDTLEAPLVFVGKPGRKVGYVEEDMVWQNIYATTETDIEVLEEMLFDKSDAWQEHQEAQKLKLLPSLEDHQDFQAVLDQFGFTAEQARAETERTDNMMELPYGDYKVKKGDSNIEGKGLFATAPIEPHEMIMPMRIGSMRTQAGRYVNHSRNPNCMPVRNGDIVWLKATRPIHGCMGGQDGEELTIDYREAMIIAIQFNSEEN